MKDYSEISFTVQNGPNLLSHCSTACRIVRSDLTLTVCEFRSRNSGLSSTLFYEIKF